MSWRRGSSASSQINECRQKGPYGERFWHSPYGLFCVIMQSFRSIRYKLVKVLYLIDSENVGDCWIPLLDLPAEETELVVFYTKNSPHMSYDSLIKLKLSDRVVTFIKCFEGTNALDFQLVSELGYRMRGNEEGEFIIVTNDTGYDAAVKYWRKKGFAVRRITGKECRNAGRVRRQRDKSSSEGQVSARRPRVKRAQPEPERVISEPVPAQTQAVEEVPDETVQEDAAVRKTAQETVQATVQESVSEETAAKSVAESVEETVQPAADVTEKEADAAAVSRPAEAEFSAVNPENTEPLSANPQDTGFAFAQPQPETNRSAPVVERKFWNGTGFSTVAPQEQAASQPEAETAESEAEEVQAAASEPVHAASETASKSKAEPESRASSETESETGSEAAQPQRAASEPAAYESVPEQTAEEPQAEAAADAPEEETEETGISGGDGTGQETDRETDEKAQEEKTARKVPAKAVATVKPAGTGKSNRSSDARKNGRKKPSDTRGKNNSKKETAADGRKRKADPDHEKEEIPSDAQTGAQEEKDVPKTNIVVDENGVSSGDAELGDLTVIVSCVGMDNLAELHNQLIQFYGEGGKQIYQSIKNGSMQIETANWDQHEKYAKYGELIFKHHGDGEKCPDDFADFIEDAGKKRDNLNSFRYALLKRYGKEKGRRYYFLLKPFVKAINEM